jgi:hypothetical protein
MATKQSNSPSGINNYGGSGPRQNIGQPQPGVGGGQIKTTRVAASATYAGHHQVNPGAKPGSGVSTPTQQNSGPQTKVASASTILGRKETASR